jgi:hypothetical protein
LSWRGWSGACGEGGDHNEDEADDGGDDDDDDDDDVIMMMTSLLAGDVKPIHACGPEEPRMCVSSLGVHVVGHLAIRQQNPCLYATYGCKSTEGPPLLSRKC